MGWIGVGVLTASILFLLYRHPLESWRSSFAQWRRGTTAATPTRISPSESKYSADDRASDDSASQNGIGTNRGIDQNDGKELDKTFDSDIVKTSELTPKAKAISSPTFPKVPVLNLEESSGVSEKGEEVNNLPSSTKTGSLDRTTPPSINPPTSSKTAAPSPNNLSTPSFSMPPPSKPLGNTSTLPTKSNPMLPPPRSVSNTSLRTPPSAAASLRVPPSSLSSSTLAPLRVPGQPQRPSRQAILEPGHSPLDWAAITSNPQNNLRGANLPPSLIRVTPSMLKSYNGRKGHDAWTSYQGKVYNITPFVPFHPGGKGELLRGAGKGSDKLFLEAHPWVNWDGMLAECMVGILVGENEISGERSEGLDDMD